MKLFEHSFTYQSIHEEKKGTFRGSVTYDCFCLRRAPIESIFKILITSIHFTIEIVTGYNGPSMDGDRHDDHSYLRDENAHHTAMLFGFFIGAWVEILIYSRKVPLPPLTPNVLGVLAFAIEALLMMFHLHARSMIDAHIHQLLGLTVVCSVLFALGECLKPNAFWLIVARSFFDFTQGTWFVQAAFVLRPQTDNPLFLWDANSHRSISLLTMSYAYHLAGNAVILILIFLSVHATYSFLSRLYSTINEDAHFQTFDDEDDVEVAPDQYKLILANEDDITV